MGIAHVNDGIDDDDNEGDHHKAILLDSTDTSGDKNVNGDVEDNDSINGMLKAAEVYSSEKDE